MVTYEYKVVPAPKKGERTRGVKGAEARFAHTLMAVMNEMGRDGWEYQRTDSLPCEVRSGLTGKTTSFQNMLIFRRVLAEDSSVEAPKDSEIAPVAFTRSEPKPEPKPAETPDLAVPQAKDTPDASHKTALAAARDSDELPKSVRPLGAAKLADTDGKSPEVAAE